MTDTKTGWSDLLLSLFEWHNETINIYTHLFGAGTLFYLLCCLHPFSAIHQSDYVSDKIVSLSFLVCAICCLLFSSAWHLMSGCATFHIFNGSACKRFIIFHGRSLIVALGLDYCGVSALICSSIFTMSKSLPTFAWTKHSMRFSLVRLLLSTRFAQGLCHNCFCHWSAWRLLTLAAVVQ